MVEACPVCDTLWRLYGRATDNLHSLVGKHSEARDKGDPNSVEILAHEITIGESALRAVRIELRRHEGARHGNRQENQRAQPKEQMQEQKQ
jgi:hypothetical protein